jgi:hypothetical protein
MIAHAQYLRFWLVACLVLVALSALSCSTAPPPPKPGTPAFKWMAAGDALRKGEFLRAGDTLGDLALKESSYTERARPVALILAHSNSHALMELADKYSEGAKKAKAGNVAFYRLTGEYKEKAKREGMRFIDLARQTSDSIKGPEVTIALGMPAGSGEGPAQLSKVETGTMVPPQEVTAAEEQAIRSGIIQSFAAALGDPGKPDAARARYANGVAKATIGSYMAWLAASLYETAENFGPKQLNQPTKILEIICDETEKALKLADSNKETADLAKKLKEFRKKLPKAT